MCALTYAIHRGAMLTVSVPLQESPHETATWAETRESRGHGIWPRRPDRVVLSCLTSILAPLLTPDQHDSAQLSPARPKTGNYDELLVNMPIKVLFVLHQKAALSQPPGAHVSKRLELADYLGATAIWVSQQVSVWACIAQRLCIPTVSLLFHLCMSIYEWQVCKKIFNL